MRATILTDTAMLMAGTLAQGSTPDIPWLRIALVMILCVLLAFAAVGFLRIRYGLPFLPDRFANPITSSGIVTQAPKEKLAIVDRLAAGPSSQFLVLARGSQRYLLHVSQAGSTVLDTYTEGERAAPELDGDAE